MIFWLFSQNIDFAKIVLGRGGSSIFKISSLQKPSKLDVEIAFEKNTEKILPEIDFGLHLFWLAKTSQNPSKIEKNPFRKRIEKKALGP